MSKKDKMMKNLEKNLPEIKHNRPIKIDKDVKDDYEFSRKTYKDLIVNLRGLPHPPDQTLLFQGENPTKRHKNVINNIDKSLTLY